TVVRFDTPELTREALQERKVDAIFDDGISVMLWVNGSLSKDCCELEGGPYLEPKYFGEGMAIALTKGDRDLRNKINQALHRMRASGRFEEMVSRYFPDRVY